MEAGRRAETEARRKYRNVRERRVKRRKERERTAE